LTDYTQADTETRTRGWATVDEAGDPIIPSAITFYARSSGTDVTWTTATGVTDNGDGTGTWTITAGDLEPGTYLWWALATVGTEVIIPEDMTGTLRILDR
jgi:hypothetical protein